MKRIIFFLSFFFVLSCDKGIKYIYSPDKKYCLSIFDYTNVDGKIYSILLYGKAEDKSLPKSYIRARYWWRDSWYVLIKWEGKKAIVFQTYHDFEPYNIENSNLELEDMESESEFFSNFNDKTINNYIKLMDGVEIK